MPIRKRRDYELLSTCTEESIVQFFFAKEKLNDINKQIVIDDNDGDDEESCSDGDNEESSSSESSSDDDSVGSHTSTGDVEPPVQNMKGSN